MLDIQYNLDIPFKNFQAGQIIQSKQFNDDMVALEDKINEIILKHNTSDQGLKDHVANKNNPHEVNPNQIGTYTQSQIDELLRLIRAGGLDAKAITNLLLADNSVDSRTLKNYSVTSSKVDTNFGSGIDISNNIEIITRYTKKEIDKMFIDKVGESTYSKDELNQKFADVQAGQIVDNTIGIDKLMPNVGELINLTKNPSIKGMYTNQEINDLILKNGMPRDWGSITDNNVSAFYGVLPVANFMIADEFIAPLDNILDINVKEVVDARNTYPDLPTRLNTMEDSSVSVLNMFDEVTK